MSCKSRLLSELLPYDTSEKIRSEIKKGLAQYELILRRALEAIHFFENGELEKFDSHVGENACQSRAVKIALLSLESGIQIEELKKDVGRAREKVEDLLQKSVEELMKIGKNLDAVLEVEGAKVEVSDDELFLFKAYILAITKEYHGLIEGQSGKEGVFFPVRHSKSNPQKIIPADSDLSSNFAVILSNRIKKMISEASVEFVREVARGMSDSALRQMVSDEFSYTHNGLLACAPLFWSIKTLFLMAEKNHLPILLHVKFVGRDGEELKVYAEEFLYVKPVDQSYVYVDLEEGELDKAACIIQGVACINGSDELLSKEKWKELVKQHAVLDIILANSSVHRQYPNPSLDQKIGDLGIPEYHAYRKFGDQHGFSSNNPSVFMIQHIYPAIPRRVLGGMI